jgi:hypothetical protein
MKLWQPIQVISAAIRPATWSKSLILVPSATRRDLSNGMLRCSVVQNIIFRFSVVPSIGPKIRLQIIENLSVPLDRARRVALGPRIGDLDRVAERIAAGIT